MDGESGWENCHQLGFGGVGFEPQVTKEAGEDGNGSAEPLDVGSCDEAIVGIESCQSVSDSQT